MSKPAKTPSQTRSRKPSRYVTKAPPGGLVDPIEPQFKQTQRLYYNTIEQYNPIQSLVDGFDNFCDTRIDQILSAHTLVGKTVMGWTSEYRLRKVSIRRANSFRSYFDAVLAGETIYASCQVVIERRWRRDQEYFTNHGEVVVERSEEFTFVKIPIMVGSKYDLVLNPAQKFEQGDNPALPRGYFYINGRKKQIILYHRLKYDMPLIYPHKSGQVSTSVTCTTPSLSTFQVVVTNLYPSLELLCRTSKLTMDKDKHYLSLYNTLKIILDLVPRREWIRKFGKAKPWDPKENRMTYDALDEILTDMILDYVPEQYRDSCRSLLELNHKETDPPLVVLNHTREALKIAGESRDLQEKIVEEVYPMIPMSMPMLKAEQLAYMGSMQVMYIAGHLLSQDRNSRSLNRENSPEVVMTKLLADKYRAAVDLLNAKIDDLPKDRSQQVAFEAELEFDPSRAFASMDAMRLQISNGLSLGDCLIKGFTKGNFGSKSTGQSGSYGQLIAKTGTAKQRGTVADLESLSLAQAYSALSKCGIPSSSKGKTQDVRSLHPSSVGYQDLYRSPDDEMIGLILFLTASCYISHYKEPGAIIEYLQSYIRETRSLSHPNVVFVNGIKQGYADGAVLIQQIHRDRLTNKTLHPYMDSMFLYDRHSEIVHIITDAGRLTRPLLVVQNRELVIDQIPNGWDMNPKELIMRGAIRLVDVYELEYGRPVAQEPGYFAMMMNQLSYLERAQTETLRALEAPGDYVTIPNIGDAINQAIAYRSTYRRGTRLTEVTPQTVSRHDAVLQARKLDDKIASLRRNTNYAYCEIDADAIYGYSTGLVPHANRNAATKIAYASHILTQAIGTGDKNHVLSTDPTIMTLNRGQRPLVDTQMSRIVGTNVLPASQNVKIAVLPGTDHGMFGGGTQEDAFQVKKEAIDRGLFSYTLHKQVVFQPSPSLNTKISKPTGSEYDQLLHSKLSSNGIIAKGSMVYPGTVLMSVIYHQAGSSPQRLNRKASPDLKGIVTDVYYTENPVYVKICISDNRKVMVGSKIATMHGNKGLIGSITPEADMPKDAKTGIAPDVIINPAGIGKRGTVGFTIEMNVGMAAALKGQRINACGMDQQFRADDVSYILSAAGLSPEGTAELIDPRTQQRYTCLTSVGMVQMQVLRQTMEENCNVKGSGLDKIMFNGQPVKGRRNGGGTRYGEQEMYGMRYHNAFHVSHSVYSHSSDATTIAICTACHMMVSPGISGSYACQSCGTRNRYNAVQDTGNTIVSATTAGSFAGHLANVLSARGMTILYRVEGEQPLS